MTGRKLFPMLVDKVFKPTFLLNNRLFNFQQKAEGFVNNELFNFQQTGARGRLCSTDEAFALLTQLPRVRISKLSKLSVEY